MRLHRLQLVNFRQHANTEIAFGQGLTAIIGPNGAGKTTLLEAIAWALYGNPAARGNRESLRWNRAPARASVRVEVDFGLGAHEFRVVRGLYNAALYQDQFDAPIVESQQEVSGRVERLLGMTRQEFFNTYFTGQKELAVMAAMGPTERAKFLSRVLGYERLRLAQDRLRQRRSELRAELAGLERGLADLDELREAHAQAVGRLEQAQLARTRAREALEDARSILEAEGPAWTHAVERRERAIALESDRRVAERDVVEARREFERLDRELAEALTARGQFEALAESLAMVAPLREELERFEVEARGAGQRRSLIGQREELDGQLARAAGQLESLGDVKGRLQAAQGELMTARAAHKNAEAAEAQASTAWVRDKQDAQTKRLSLRDQYLDLQKHRERVIEAGPEGECPVCKRALGGVYKEMVDTLDRQLEEIEVRGKFFKKRIEQLEHPPEDLVVAQRRLAEGAALVELALQAVAHAEERVKENISLQAEVTRLRERCAALDAEIARLPDRYDSERHDRVRAELRKLEPVIRDAVGFEVKARRAESLVAEAETAERNASAMERKLEELGRAITDVGFDEATYLQVRQRHESAQQRLRDVELHLTSVEAEAKAAQAAADATATRIREREERAEHIRGLSTEIRLHDELDSSLQDLRVDLNAQMRPDLSERASAFLAALTEGRYHELELDEHYDVLVVEDGMTKPVISGGEEDVANLVLRLAISQMVAERAGQPLSLLVLDEIFGSLDEYRRHSVLTLLRGLADRFPQVVLITHIESVREGVDRVLRVQLDQARGAAVVTEDEATDVAA